MATHFSVENNAGNVGATPNALGAQVFTTSGNPDMNNQQNQPSANQWSFGSRIGSGINTTRSSATIADIKKYLEDNKGIFSTQETDPGVKILFLDNASEDHNNLQYSAVIVATWLPGAPDKVAFYPIALEKTQLRPLGDQIFESEGQTIQLPWTASDAMNDAYYQAITAVVSAAFPKATLYPVSGMTTGPKLDLTQDTQALLDLLDNASRANLAILLSVDGTYNRLLALSELDKSSTKLINIEVAGIEQGKNLQGLPVRKDVVLELYSQANVKQVNPNNRNANTFNMADNRRETFSKFGGFFDFSFRERQTLLPYGQQNVNPLDASRALMPRFVVTSGEMGAMNSYSAMLLGLASLFPLTNQQVWTSILWQRAQRWRLEAEKKEFDATDVGVFNVLTGIVDPKTGKPVAVDTKEDAFGAPEFARFMNIVATPDIAISIDVPRASEESWCWNILTGIAKGNTQAMKTLVDAADALTDNKFRPTFAAALGLTQEQAMMAGTETKHFFSEWGNQLPDGYFSQTIGKNQDQHMRSAKSVDLMYVMNKYWTKQEGFVADFARDFIPGAFSNYAVRVASLISKLTNITNMQLTGFSDRHTFTPAFLNALWQATAKDGLTPQIVFPGMIGAPTSASLYAQFTTQGLTAQNVNFAQFGGNPNQPGVQGTNYTYSVFNGGQGWNGMR